MTHTGHIAAQTAAAITTRMMSTIMAMPVVVPSVMMVVIPAGVVAPPIAPVGIPTPVVAVVVRISPIPVPAPVGAPIRTIAPAVIIGGVIIPIERVVTVHINICVTATAVSVIVVIIVSCRGGLRAETLDAHCEVGIVVGLGSGVNHAIGVGHRLRGLVDRFGIADIVLAIGIVGLIVVFRTAANAWADV